MAQDRNKGQTTMGIIRKFLGLGLAAFIGLSATGAKVNPAYCNQNDVIGDTPIITNAEKWVSNLLGDGKYDPSTDEGRTELARDVIKAFGAEDTSVRGRLAFKLTGVSPDKTVYVTGITANGNFTIDWGDGTREVIENPPLLAGAMPRAPKSASHKFPPGVPTPTIDFPEGEIIKIDGTGDGESNTDKSFIRDEDGNGLISAVNVSEYDGPITWGIAMFAGSPVQELNIPTNVSVGIGCFAMCQRLKKLRLDSTRVSWGAFRVCANLGDVTIGKHCQSIGARCFDSCLALSNVVFESGSSLKVIDSDVFRGCGNLKKLELPDGLESFDLGPGTGITDLKLPDSIKTLGNLFMVDCWLRETFKLPASIESLHATFAGWTNLQYITIPRSCKNIYSDTFDNCWYLTNVNFETGCRLAQIGGHLGGNPESMGAFYKCKSLKNIRIPLGAGYIAPGQSHQNDSIGIWAFDGCDVLEEVTLDCAFQNKYMTIGSTIFKDCPLIRKVSFTSEYAPVSAGNYAFLNPLPDGFKISIPNGSSGNYKNQTGWSNYASYFEERPLESCKVAVRCNSRQAINETIKVGPTYCEDTFIVDWGDGNVDEYESGTSPTHTYTFPDYNGRSGDKPKQIVVKIKGIIKRIEGCKDGSGNVAHTYLADGANNNADKTISYVYVDADDMNIRIGDYCFKGCSLTEYSPGQYITKIGDNCFQNSLSLANVEFNSRGWLDSIGEYSFAGCPMASISFPKSLYDIGAYSFYGCKNLKDISYAKNGNIETIGDYAFAGNKIDKYSELVCILENIEIPDTVKRIGNGAFDGCWYAKAISLPQDGVLEEIGDRAFYNALALTGEISIPKSVRKVGANAFYGARAISGINLPQDGHLEYIGDKAFYYVTNHLDDITIPATVKWIGDQSFGRYSFQSNITFAEGSKLEHIGFIDDKVKFGRVEFPSTLKYFGGYYSWIVDGEMYTPDMPDGIEYIGSLGVNDQPTNETFTIPSSARHLERTFDGWTKLKSITIPSGVTNINGICNWCNELESITFVNGCPLITAIPANTFSYCRALKSIQIPQNVTTIGSEAFYDCSSLTSITLPNTVNKIGNSAFSSCDNLASINIPEGVTELPNYVVSSAAITEFVIPSTVTKVGYSLCSGCNNLTRIECRATTPPSVSSTYYEIFGTIPSGCYIYVPASAVYTYSHADGWSKYSSKIRSL